MKKTTNQRTTPKVAIVAGATALMALTPNLHAQTSVDNLLNKLEQKGVLTPSEADDLKSENATNSVADFNQAMNSRFPIPDWVTSYKLSGDFRGRFDDVSTDTPFTAGHDNNIRLRYRLRVGLLVNMKDNLQVGFRLGTGDAPAASNTTGGNPLSSNTTLQGNASKKYFYVDTAYGKWTPINGDTWVVGATLGKMEQPFQESSMVFDPDYTPEGAALQATCNLNDQNSVVFNSAAFVLDQFNTRGPFMYGGQAIWNAKLTPKLASAVGVAAYDIVDKANLKTTYDSNLGNTLTGGSYTYAFNPIVASGSLTYTLDHFPLYPGAFPIKLAGEYLDNPDADSNNKD